VCLTRQELLAGAMCCAWCPLQIATVFRSLLERSLLCVFDALRVSRASHVLRLVPPAHSNRSKYYYLHAAPCYLQGVSSAENNKHAVSSI